MKKLTKEKRKLNREKTLRKYNIKKWYGITESEYDNLIESQDNKCAICKSEDNKRKNSKYFFIDHNHDTGKIRGLLCDKCNKLLGSAFDNTEILKKAIKYLSEYK